MCQGQHFGGIKLASKHQLRENLEIRLSCTRRQIAQRIGKGNTLLQCSERKRVETILKELKLVEDKSIVLMMQGDNKCRASKVRRRELRVALPSIREKGRRPAAKVNSRPLKRSRALHASP